MTQGPASSGQIHLRRPASYPAPQQINRGTRDLEPNNQIGLWDPVLYRCFYLVLWRSRQDPNSSRAEIDAAARIMRGELGWCPESVQLPSREDLSYQPTIVWGRDDNHRSTIKGHPGKFTNRFALAHHEDLIVLQGL